MPPHGIHSQPLSSHRINQLSWLTIMIIYTFAMFMLWLVYIIFCVPLLHSLMR